MFLHKYLDVPYLDLVYSNYEEEYLHSLDADNFHKVYLLLKENNFYFIADIILNYLALFTIEVQYVQMAMMQLKNTLGDNWVSMIGKNMTLVNKIIDLAIDYSQKEDNSTNFV